MRDYTFCFAFNMHIHGMYDNSLHSTWCSGVALSGSLIRLYPLNIIKTPEGKGDLWLRVSVSEYEGHKKKGEWWIAENTLTQV